MLKGMAGNGTMTDADLRLATNALDNWHTDLDGLGMMLAAVVTGI